MFKDDCNVNLMLLENEFSNCLIRKPHRSHVASPMTIIGGVDVPTLGGTAGSLGSIITVCLYRYLSCHNIVISPINQTAAYILSYSFRWFRGMRCLLTP